MASKKEKAMKEKIEQLENLVVRLTDRSFLKHEIKEHFEKFNPWLP